MCAYNMNMLLITLTFLWYCNTYSWGHCTGQVIVFRKWCLNYDGLFYNNRIAVIDGLLYSRFYNGILYVRTLYADDRPNLKAILLLKWNNRGQKKEFPKISPHWNTLGVTFGIEPAVLHGFQVQNMLDQESC